ncbi:hypothetical protein LVIS_1080 [Levilactobacillus brevis ATCC 367]|uniref:Uncharacterized protein n=1 Tax=Levilactobacillus brevis (strain ATCC 367 / BCRC 12310 / CIP 105137 / JCM 1170 / LMG 11437 / NCIMB 947 / NCTC 947) TaxID=387344 RepID=Q03RG0_LEVBA|nr:pyocin knob domain-containing protein [Levilactobacillus brevis]ABJ64212.1 hypothetical protein LVIS_1080 [Levilactobacillus brevis ATCC 367]
MADSSRTIMTDAGFALETRVRADETKMQFTRAAISTDDHFSDTDDALAKLTELYNIQQDGKVTAVQVINTTTVYVQVDVNQAESKADYQMRSAALYAKDDDGTEVLYGVTVLQDPVFVHKDADGSYLGFGINTTVGKASNVVVVVDPANMVTQQVFESTMKNYYTKAEVDAKFVTDDDFASKLPKNIATTDAANTFVKSQTLAGGATDGKGNAYATTKDVATGLNNGLSTKVNTTDMRKPANDVLGLEDIKSSVLPSGTDLYTLINTSGQPLSYFVPTYTSAQSMVNKPTTKLSAFKLNTDSIGDSTSPSYNYTFLTLKDDSDGSIYEALIHTDGSGAIIVTRPWYKVADDSTVVHSTDMRKPASDVAGIEEVNAKQDKIGYTPADDSKVVHSTVTQLTSTDMNTVLTAGFYSLNSGTNGMPNADAWTIYQVIPLSSVNGVQVAYETNNAILGMRSWNSGSGKIIFTSWVQFADDSKVAHLAGTNNFDTVPTVNNNPLLLASSLPSDLARTGQDANFTAKLQQNGQDVALANNTIARNPNTGVVSEPVDFTKLTVNGGKSVATSDDLNNYYHANASDAAALAAAKSATVPGIFWFEEV